jgi:hypothetical protein
MTRIRIPDPKDAHPDTHQVLNAVEQALGFVPNLHRLMALSPKAFLDGLRYRPISLKRSTCVRVMRSPWQ